MKLSDADILRLLPEHISGDALFGRWPGCQQDACGHKQGYPELADLGASVAEGRARVNGEGVELIASRRLRYPAEPDLRYIDPEVITAGEEESQRVNVAHAPVRDYVNLRVTQRKIVELTHGNYSGCSDALPDTSVLNIVSVKQLDTTYEMGTDFVRAGDTIDWSPSGLEQMV